MLEFIGRPFYKYCLVFKLSAAHFPCSARHLALLEEECGKVRLVQDDIQVPAGNSNKVPRLRYLVVVVVVINLFSD